MTLHGRIFSIPTEDSDTKPTISKGNQLRSIWEVRRGGRGKGDTRKKEPVVCDRRGGVLPDVLGGARRGVIPLVREKKKSTRAFALGSSPSNFVQGGVNKGGKPGALLYETRKTLHHTTNWRNMFRKKEVRLPFLIP